MGELIYLDHAATTPVDPAVLEGMLPYFSERYGNASSIYGLGREAREALDQARLRCAEVLGCQPSEIVFTSGATESDNLALRGVAWAARIAGSGRDGAPHIVTTAIEHHAVLHTAQSLERQGFAATYLAPDERGIVGAPAIEAALRPETCLISLMHANNESGAIQPVRKVAEIACERGILVHTDAVQAAGMLPLGVDELGVDLLSLSAHKFYGPKGVGLLYVRKGTAIDFQQQAGSQEQGRRGGTENVAGIVGLGLALERAEERRVAYIAHCRSLRDRLMRGVVAAIPDARVNGPLDPALRLPNNLNVAIPGVDGETVLFNLDLAGIAASAGSACTTGNTEPGHVLLAMGLTAELCKASLRFTVGRSNTEGQIDRAVKEIVRAVERVRAVGSNVLRTV